MFPTYLFYLYLLIISAFAVISTAQGLSYYKDSSEGLGKPKRSQRVLVILPCRDLEYKFKDNLDSLKGQARVNYKIIAVVDSKEDKAIPFLESSGIKWILAEKDRKGSGKVNAIATAIRKFRNYDIYAIADSDILVSNDWLSRMIAPLYKGNVGLSTSYPYFKAEAGFWSRVKMVWSFVGEGMMESELLRFGWGGSLVFRKELMDQKNFEYFRRSLSDDVAISTIVRNKGLRLAYVRGAQPTTKVVDDFKMFSEWSNRQTALSMLGDGKVFWIGLPYYTMCFLLLVSAVILSIFYSYYALLLFIPVALGFIKNYGRLRTSCPDFIIINTIMPLIFIANLLVAKSMKSIEWRGRNYDLVNE